MKGRAVVLLLLVAFLTSCSSGYAEHRDGASLADAVYGSVEEAASALDELAELPEIGEGATLLFAGVKNGETVLEIRSDVSLRWEYERRLNYLWYKSIDAQPETGDRLCTYLHPTGWRVAFYDNRRNAALRSAYGEDGYVWQVRICRIKVGAGDFPRYPENGSILWFDEHFREGFEAFPRHMLPDDFPALPECSVLTNAERNEAGLRLTFITTHQAFETYLSELSDVYKPDGGCYADGEHNYFYVSLRHITVIDESEEREESVLTEESYSEEALREMEIQKDRYFLEELPKQVDENGSETEPDVNGYCKVTISFVRHEWVPEWWKFGGES